MLQEKVFCCTVKFDSITSQLTAPASVGTPFDSNVTPLVNDHKNFTSLWDTGATRTVISKTVVESCDLKPVGLANVHTASGTHTVYTYYISIGLPNKVVVPVLLVTEGVLTDTDILIGADIINRGDFLVTNFNDKTVFSFRMPSLRCIDFVKEQKEKKQHQ